MLTKILVFGNIVLALRKRKTCASGSVGGARPCQGRGRGFESRLALFKEHPEGCFFFAHNEITNMQRKCLFGCRMSWNNAIINDRFLCRVKKKKRKNVSFFSRK